MNATAPVVVVGAGAAGLACALTLHRAGVPVRVIEAADRVGGRVATDTFGGFRCDRGFQVLVDSYPEARALLDYRALRLGRFRPGALVRWRGRFHRLADPRRAPLAALSALGSALAGWRNGLAALHLARHGLAGGSALDAVRAAGFTPELVDAFFRPWFGGIFLDRALGVAAERANTVVARFASGAAAVPAGGMAAIPHQLAAGLPAGVVALGRTVRAVCADGVTMADGEEVAARAVVVAVAPPAAARLVPGFSALAFLTVRAVHFAVPAPLPFDGRWLVLDGDGTGPATTLASPSAVAAGYAPPGQHLLTASVLGDAEDDPAAAVLAQCRAWFGSAVDGWRHLVTQRIAYAQHRQHPGDPTTPRRVSGLYIAGDHTTEASLDGALRSGRLAAEAILAG